MAFPTPLRRDLLLQFGALFVGAMLIAVVGVAVLLPGLESPTEILLFLVILILADSAIVFGFGTAFLRRRLVQPTERLRADLNRIAQGDLAHRVGGFDSEEFEEIRRSVNTLADRLIADRKLLAENVESLDRTNEDLIAARDQIIHSARLASVGTLAAVIAHEVGNPLGAIMTFVDVARRRIGPDQGGAEVLDMIRGEADRIDRIVRGLLDYARPGTEAAGPAAPGDVIARVRDLLDSQGKLDGVDDRWEVGDEVPRVVMDPRQLEQVLVNLLLNALDAMEGQEHRGFVVRLSVEGSEVHRLPRRRADDPPGIDYRHRRRVSMDDAGRGVHPLFNARQVVVIEVADDGPGIPEEEWESVFDPFYTTKEPGVGTGLGLSICARLIEGMGGRIELAGGGGGGARFLIRLPAHPEESP